MSVASRDHQAGHGMLSNTVHVRYSIHAYCTDRKGMENVLHWSTRVPPTSMNTTFTVPVQEGTRTPTSYYRMYCTVHVLYANLANSQIGNLGGIVLQAGPQPQTTGWHLKLSEHLRTSRLRRIGFVPTKPTISSKPSIEITLQDEVPNVVSSSLLRLIICGYQVAFPNLVHSTPTYDDCIVHCEFTSFRHLTDPVFFYARPT